MSDDIQGQLANLRAMVGEIERDQKLILRKLGELANSDTISLGGTKLVTRLRTGQRIFVDGRDTGSGLSIVTRGYIEPDVMKVLQRAFTAGAVFLDIGANFGFYSIIAGGQIGPKGKVYAFEANPNLIDYIERSIYINGLGRIVTIINKAVSDHTGAAQFGFSFAEIGGGSLAKGEDGGSELQHIKVPLVRIDDVLPAGLVVDCAKLDVEGNELAALRGMRNVIERSPNIQLVIEFFPGLLGDANGGAQLLDYLTELGLGYWRIAPKGRIESVPRDELLRGGDSYLVASRVRPVDRSLILRPNSLQLMRAVDASGFLAGPAGSVLVHGPYWYLQAGSYRVVIEGEIEGALDLSVNQEFGFLIASGRIDASQRSLEFDLFNDARHFEIVVRSTGPESKLRIESIAIEER
jgi:FkbM family methyltransferase